MKRVYWIAGIIVVAVVALIGYFRFARAEKDQYEWRTSTVEKGDVKVVVTATGSLSADTTVQVGTQVSGIVSKIFVDYNSVVKKGQVIAIIDTTFLAAAVVDARASLNKAQVQVDLTKRNFERTDELFKAKVAAQADYDQAWSDYQTALANERSARASLDRALINLRYATIVAPVSGVVVSRAVDIGQTVAASFNTPTLFTIANDLTQMQVQANIDEADIGKIRVGQDVTFTVDAYDNLTFAGKVRQIRLQPTILQNVVNYTVIIDVPNPDLKLLPGMTANITVLIQEADSVLKVPASALRFNPPKAFIDKMMKIWPDSVRQKVSGWMERAQQGSGSQAHTGAAGRPAAQSGQPGQGQNWQARRGMNGTPGQGGTASGSNTGAKRGEWGQGKWDFGFVWIRDGKMLIPYRVKTGLSDGSYTEVAGRIKEGEEVVTGMIAGESETAGNQQTQSPFMPQFRRRR